MSCNTSSQCHWPLGDCFVSSNLNTFNAPLLESHCFCFPGLYSLFSAGDTCVYATTADALVLQIFLILLHLAVLGLCVYKLYCLSDYVPSYFAFPKLLCYIWMIYSSAMSSLFIILASRTLTGTSLIVCTHFLVAISVPCVIGPMLYSAWFTAFVIQLVTHQLRHLILWIFYGLCCLFALLILIFAILIATTDDSLFSSIFYFLNALVFACIGVALVGTPISILARYRSNPPALIVEMRWTWVLHFFLGLATVVGMVDTLLVAVQSSDPHWPVHKVALLDVNFYFLISWMVMFGLVVIRTINHREENPADQHQRSDYVQL